MKKISADDIAGFFREWADAQGRRRLPANGPQRQNRQNLPLAKHCCEIAAMLNSPYPDVDSDTIAMIQHARDQQAAYEQIVGDAKVLRNAIQKFKLGQEKRAKSLSKIIWQLPEEVTKIDDACAEFLQWNPASPRGQPPKKFQNKIALMLAEECHAALVSTHWRKNISLDREEGPVAYVVSRCITILEQKEISPSGASERIRAAKRGE